MEGREEMGRDDDHCERNEGKEHYHYWQDKMLGRKGSGIGGAKTNRNWPAILFALMKIGRKFLVLFPFAIRMQNQTEKNAKSFIITIIIIIKTCNFLFVA